jgi:uncharacterized protein (TIGR02996 family)
MCSTKDALLAAIATMPEEDTPRLAFADYLDEEGDKLAAARAEFIRLQVMLRRVTAESTETLAARVRAAELRERFAKAWGFVAQSETSPWYAVRRGFVSELTIDSPPRGQRNDIRRLLQQEPVGLLRAVCPYAAGGWLGPPPPAVDWLDVFGLRRVRHLELSGSYWSDREVARVLGFASFPALTTLTLTGVPLTAAGVAAITDCERLCDLAHLSIDNTRQWSNEVKGWAGGVVGVRALAAAPRLAGLRELSLRAAGIETAGAFALADSPYLTGLTAPGALALWENPGIGAAGRAALVERFGEAVCF